MKIKKIISQHRRDFVALYECEHCGDIMQSTGYDDAYFHNEVIPKKVCKECERSSGEDYRPLTTKYPEGFII
jgi:ribosomal protein L37AE/L43A